jgi:hypothetical protein
MVGLEETLLGELHGAEHRLARAQNELMAFRQINMGRVDGEIVFVGRMEEAEDLRRQEHALIIELDEAIRQHQQCLVSWSELKSQNEVQRGL